MPDQSPAPGASDPPRIRIVRRTETKFDLLRLLNQQARAKGTSLHGGEDPRAMLDEIAGTMRAAAENPIMLHGLRVQAMFGYVAAALGNCELVQELDAGELYYAGEELLPPDYLLITRGGGDMLVEVKNHHAEPGRPFSLDAAYLNRLKRYAALVKKELLIAIYWSRLRLWTLVAVDRFNVDEGNGSVSFEDCFKGNEMARLGDAMIATLSPLSLRLQADRTQPRAVGPDGETPFTIAVAELLSEERVLTGEESKIAWFLISHGDWVEETSVDVADGLLNSMTMSYAPGHEIPSEQPFRQIGILSRMISHQFTQGTTADGKVTLLSPKDGPEKLGIVIPPDYSSTSLPLWRFQQVPSPRAAAGP